MNTNIKQLAEDVIVQYTSLLQDWTPSEATIAISMEDSYIYYAPKQIDLQISVGQPVSPTSIVGRVHESAKKIEETMEDETSRYFGIGYPITIQDKGGVLLIALPTTYKEDKTPKPIHFITGKHEDEWQPIPIDEISFFESLNKKNWCYKQTNAFQISQTLKDLTDRLPNYFMRIHRSYIINIHNISKITRDFSSNLLIVMKDGQQLPVSQSYVNNVRKVLEF